MIFVYIASSTAENPLKRLGKFMNCKIFFKIVLKKQSKIVIAIGLQESLVYFLFAYSIPLLLSINLLNITTILNVNNRVLIEYA